MFLGSLRIFDFSFESPSNRSRLSISGNPRGRIFRRIIFFFVFRPSSPESSIFYYRPRTIPARSRVTVNSPKVSHRRCFPLVVARLSRNYRRIPWSWPRTLGFYKQPGYRAIIEFGDLCREFCSSLRDEIVEKRSILFPFRIAVALRFSSHQREGN